MYLETGQTRLRILDNKYRDTMKKKLFDLLLLAALVLGLGMTATSCKDDDDDAKKEEKSGDSQTGMSELADDQLRDLICQWCDVQKDELAGTAWKNQTFEPTIGFVDDESTPFYRSLPVGTLEEADHYAVLALGTLGIDGNKPDGFSFSDDKVGTVSYRHSEESNILAVIDVEIRQLPRLVRLYLTKQAGDNAVRPPYYQCGNVIKYKNRYYICASDHKYGEKARFITFNDQSEHTTGTFGWSGVGDDVVYNDDMASPETILAWLDNILCLKKSNRESLRGVLIDSGLTEEQINQVIPFTEGQTFMLLDAMTDEYHMLMNSTTGGTSRVISAYTWGIQKECQGDPGSLDFDETDEKNIQEFIIAAPGMMLTNKVRWRVNLTSSWDQWQPYIFLIQDSKFRTMRKALGEESCLTTLSPSHFVWQDVGTVYLEETLTEPEGIDMRPDIKAATYHVVMLAIYWQHEVVNIMGYPTRLLFDFTKDFINSTYRNNPVFATPNYYWYRRSITSKEITFTDKGSPQSKYDLIK